MEMTAYLLLVVSIVIGVIGQLLLKHGMSQQDGFQPKNLIVLIYKFPIIGGFGSYLISTLLYFKVLASLDLSLAYPTVSLGYVLVIFMSKIIFGEAVSLTRWTAVTIICIGVFLVGLGTT